jgi:glycosyltransferase involved in cell wall biosynthesis
MRILFLTIGDEQIASSRTRVLQYLPYFNKSGITAKVIVRDPYILFKTRNVFKRISQILHVQFNMLYFFLAALFYSFIFIQKVYLPKCMSTLFVFMGKQLVYDFDDAIYTSFDFKEIKSRKLSRLKHILKKAGLIIVENDMNKEFSEQFNKNVIIITGPIECSRYKPSIKSNNEKIVIGWIGSPNSSIYLSLVEKPLKKLSEKYPAKFELLLIGAPAVDMPGVDLYIQPWTIDTEIALLDKFDIGLMPLYNDPWCLGKGGYKILQYMAMGIPTIASPVGINCELIKNGENGYLAGNEDDWIKYLEELILNKERRKQLGALARQIAVREYSFEKYSEMVMKELKKLSGSKNFL